MLTKLPMTTWPRMALLLQRLSIFGVDILDHDGRINRKKLGAIVFASEEKLAALNQLTHPYVRQVLQEKTKIYQIAEETEHKNFLLVLMIPLLFESQLNYLVDQTMVVYCPKETQISRLIMRNHLSKAEAEQRIRAQWPIESKIQRADILINNSQSPDFTRQQVMEWLGEKKWDPYCVQH